MTVLDEKALNNTAESGNDLVKEKDDLNDHDQELITASEWAKDQKSLISHDRAELIHKDLILVGDKELTDRERTDSVSRLVNGYFRTPIYSKAWAAWQSHIKTILTGAARVRNNEMGYVLSKEKNICVAGHKGKPTQKPVTWWFMFQQRVVANLFIAVQEVEDECEVSLSFLPPAEAIKKTGAKLNTLLLYDILGRTYRQSVTKLKTSIGNSLGSGAGISVLEQTINNPQEGFFVTGGQKTVIPDNYKPPNIPASPDDGIAGFDGSGSGDWADCIKGHWDKPPSEYTRIEKRIDVDRVLNQAGLTQKELMAINVGLNDMKIVDYAREQGIKANSLRAAQNRAIQKLRKALKIK